MNCLYLHGFQALCLFHTLRSENCDFRVQVPSACDRHAKLRVDNNGKVNLYNVLYTCCEISLIPPGICK